MGPTMTDTVFLLGAGFSFDAGIPLLGSFSDRMYEFALRRRANGATLTEEDEEIFSAAMRTRDELDGYHGRAMFDDRNIEDVLSILSFNVLAGTRKDRDKLKAMTRAIARTIELSCTVKHPGLKLHRSSVISDGPDLYRAFWIELFKSMERGVKAPALITFNYDLVLERSLLQTLISTNFSQSRQLPFQQLRIDYGYPLHHGARYAIEYMTYEKNMREMQRIEGTRVKETTIDDPKSCTTIDLLKLHGSLNFPRKKGLDVDPLTSFRNLTGAIADPLILPPVFNKMTSDAPIGMWRKALDHLRRAKNVVIVGYSLPQTDIYMQYFLKAALGPNVNLNRIFVFDPVLFSDGESNNLMRARYEACFSPQLRSRIVFNPSGAGMAPSKSRGTAEHFVHCMAQPGNIVLY